MLSIAEYKRYSRHLLLDNFDEGAQLRLSSAKGVVFGVGGLGCQVASALISAGVGELVLVDDDVIEASNLPRQWLFTDADIGKKKVDAARARLTAMQPNGQIHVIDNYSNQAIIDKHLHSSQLILDCTDSVASRQRINQLALNTGVPLISAAASGFTGTVLPLKPNSTGPCYCCTEIDSKPSQTCLEQGIFSPVVALTGQLQSLLALSFLSATQPIEWGKLHYFDGQQMTLRHFSVTKNPTCTACKTLTREHKYAHHM